MDHCQEEVVDDTQLVAAVRYLKKLGFDSHPLAAPDAPYDSANDFTDRIPGHAMDGVIRALKVAHGELDRLGVKVQPLTPDIETALAVLRPHEFDAINDHLARGKKWSADYVPLDDEEQQIVRNVVELHRPRAKHVLQLSATATDPALKTAYDKQQSAAFLKRVGTKPRGRIADRLEAAEFLERTGPRKR